MIVWLFITIVVVVLGVTVSLTLGNWLWFSRSGSLVVVCGLFIAKWDLTNKIGEESLDYLESTIKKVHFEKGGTEDNLDMENVKSNLRMKMVDYNNPLYVMTEFYIVGIGTIIWGFGDLVGELVESIKCAT